MRQVIPVLLSVLFLLGGALTFAIGSVAPGLPETLRINQDGGDGLDPSLPGMSSAVRLTEDFGICDTLRIARVYVDAEPAASRAIGVPIMMYNDQELCSGTYGFCYDSDDLIADSVSWLGSAVGHISTLIGEIDLTLKTILIGFEKATEENGLMAADTMQLVATLWFTLAAGAPEEDIMIDTTFIPPSSEVESIACDRASPDIHVCPGGIWRYSVWLLCPTMGFDPLYDGYGFANCKDSCWPQEEWDTIDYCDEDVLDCDYDEFWCARYGGKESLYPSWEMWLIAYGRLQCYYLDPDATTCGWVRSPTAKAWFSSNAREWGGSCFGFAISSLLFFDKLESISDMLSHPGPLIAVGAYPGRKVINRYQVYQSSKRSRARDLEAYFDDTKITPVETLLEFQTMLCTGGEHAALLMHNQGPAGGGHTVVPLSIHQDDCDPDIFYISIYDNNKPRRVRQIRIDKGSNTWLYEHDDNPHTDPWEGDIGLFLSAPISVYAEIPELPNYYGPGKEFDDGTWETDSLSEVVSLYVGKADSVTCSSADGSIGCHGTNNFCTCPVGCDITPYTGYETPPIGYHLPNNPWQFSFAALSDSSFYAALFTDRTIMRYTRAGFMNGIREELSYPGDDSTLWLHNSDCWPEHVRYGIEKICCIPDSEVVVSLSQVRPIQCDSIQYRITPEHGLRTTILGSPRADISFDLRMEIVSSTGQELFFHEEVTLAGVSGFEVVPDWGESTAILTDPDGGGIYTDTVYVENEAAVPYVCGDADASGAIDIDDVVCLISYIFTGDCTPDPTESGDTDCSGGVDIDDVVYLINYIFVGGNEPCDIDGDGLPDC